MYRQIRTEMWTDPKFKTLEPAEKLLFVYFITNPHAHVSGIYYLPLVTIMHETGLTEKALRRGIDTLSKGYLCGIDGYSEVVFVRNMLRYQGKGEKIVASVAQQLGTLHNSPLIKDFLEEYKDWQIPYRYPIEGVSEVASPVPDPVPVPDPKIGDPKISKTAEEEVTRWRSYFEANSGALLEKFKSEPVDWPLSVEAWLGWISENWKETKNRKDPINTITRWIYTMKFFTRLDPSRPKPKAKPKEKTTCPACGGKGEERVGLACAKCHGSGYLYVEVAP